MLCWNVYYGDFNARDIKLMNIFNHWSFWEACVNAKKKYGKDKEKFAEEVKSWLRYLFWAKCEWEIILDHWPDGEWSNLRTSMSVSDMVNMYRAAGQKCDGWQIDDRVMNKTVSLHIYPEWYQYRDRKIDVCEQVMNNWDVFIDYLWEHRSELKARK